jgi:hypothetical protein
VSEKNQQVIDLLKRVDREGAVALPPIKLTGVESELIGNAISVNPYEPLMHYMKFENFMKMLASESLRTKRLDTYEDDPLEGLYPKANQHELASLDSVLFQQLGAVQNPEELIVSNRIERQSAYIHCWYADVFENKSMWEEYGDDGRGVCLRTTACRLESSVRHSDDLLTRVCKITYLDEHTPIPTTISFLPFSRKRTKFSGEKEIRLIAEIKMEALPKDSNGYLLTPEETRHLPVNLERLLEAVVIGPNCDQAEVAKLKVAVHAKITGRIVWSSSLACW